MSDGSTIEWLDRPGTRPASWNPIRGCSRVSPGCGGPHHEGGCYAEKIAARFSDPGQPFHGFAERTAHGGRWTGKLALLPEKLTEPLRWREPRTIFVNSMSDLFHENLPDEEIDRVFAVMALTGQHTHLVLTKRPERMRQWFADVDRADRVGLAMLTLVDRIPHGHRRVPWPLPNVWLGVSAERQKEADERIPDLLATPAAVRFISLEPLLGPIDLDAVPVTAAPGFFGGALRWHHRGKCHEDEGIPYPTLDWVIVGGESGPDARPMHPRWARDLRDQCDMNGVPFFYKQTGEWLQRDCVHIARRHAVFDADGTLTPDVGAGTAVDCLRTHVVMEFVGKKAAGRELDGREHSEFPVTDGSRAQPATDSHDSNQAEEVSA